MLNIGYVIMAIVDIAAKKLKERKKKKLLDAALRSRKRQEKE